MDDLTPQQRHEAYGTNKPPLGALLCEVYLEVGRPKYESGPEVTFILRPQGKGFTLSIHASDCEGRPDLTDP